MILPNDLPTTTEISLITGKTEIYNASGSLTSYQYQYYIVPIFVYLVLAIPVIWLGNIIYAEFFSKK